MVKTAVVVSTQAQAGSISALGRTTFGSSSSAFGKSTSFGFSSSTFGASSSAFGGSPSSAFGASSSGFGTSSSSFGASSSAFLILFQCLWRLEQCLWWLLRQVWKLFQCVWWFFEHLWGILQWFWRLILWEAGDDICVWPAFHFWPVLKFGSFGSAVQTPSGTRALWQGCTADHNLISIAQFVAAAGQKPIRAFGGGGQSGFGAVAKSQGHKPKRFGGSPSALEVLPSGNQQLWTAAAGFGGQSQSPLLHSHGHARQPQQPGGLRRWLRGTREMNPTQTAEPDESRPFRLAAPEMTVKRIA